VAAKIRHTGTVDKLPGRKTTLILDVNVLYGTGKNTAKVRLEIMHASRN